jgi:hypothetical protein
MKKNGPKTSEQHSSITSFFALFLMVLVLLAGCAKEEDPPPETSENTTETLVEAATKLPEEVSKLYVEKGNLSSDRVLLYLIGGPSNTLENDYFDILELSDYHEVYVHQAQTYNKEVVIGLNKDLSFEQAIAENKVSVQMLHKVINHFKAQGKDIYLIGHSFGAFLLHSYLATYDDSTTPALAMAGRLAMPDEVWKGYRDRTPYYFKDGTTPILQTIPEQVTTENLHELYASMRLQAGLGHYRYMELLKGKDLSNLMVAYGEKDGAVGRLNEEELQFLNQHQARVYAIPDGEHGSMVDMPHRAEILKLFFKQD